MPIVLQKHHMTPFLLLSIYDDI